jgi:catechol 2,3-dioxygenase-like lactoylglutathione lyase family enzyme
VKIKLTSVMVDNQAKAHKFYTEVLGFVTKQDYPVGEARWLIVVSPDVPDGVELLLEPIGPAFAKSYQKSLFDEGVPITAFAVEDVRREYDKLKARGVAFKGEPTDSRGTPATAVFDDTCGNYIMLFES